MKVYFCVLLVLGLPFKTESTHPPPVVNNLSSTSVNILNVPVDATGVVYTFDITDANGDAISLFQSFNPPGNVNDYFEFNENTYEISVKPGAVLDANQPDVQFQIVPFTPPTEFGKTVTLNISITGPPVFVNLDPTVMNNINVMEGTTGVVFTVSASDPDSDQITLIGAFPSPPNAGDFFVFNPTSGAISVKEGTTLDSTTPQTVLFQVIPFTTADGVGLLAELTINIISAQVNTAPVFDNTFYIANPSGSTAGTYVYGFGPNTNRVTDPDVGDSLTFSFDYTTSSQYFGINPSTGDITFSMNYDASTFGITFTLSVKVTDNAGAFATTIVFVKVTNTLQAIPNLPTTVSLPENSLGNTDVYDVNYPTTVTFSLDQIPPSSPSLFVINSMTGQVSLESNAVIDYENLPTTSYNLEITATDSTGISSPSATLTVNITDVNENPMFTQTTYNVPTTLGPIGQEVVGSLLTSVNDPDFNDILTFQLLSGMPDFSIDTATGRITYAVDNSQGSVSLPTDLSVLVVDQNGKYSIATFKVSLIIQNQAPAFFSLPSTTNIPENQPAGNIFYYVDATDADGDDLTYSLPTTSPENLFNINEQTGDVSLKVSGTLPVSTSPLTIDIVVSDGTAFVSSTLIIVIDSVNQPPTFTNLQTAITRHVSLVTGVKLFTVTAVDNNGDSLTYSISYSTFPELLFAINATTGDLSLKYSLSSVSTSVSSIDVDITVTDGTDTTTGVLTIIIDRSNPNNPPSFSNLPRFVSVPVAQPTGVGIFTAQAADPDGDAITYSLASTYPSILFEINQLTGIISLKSPNVLTDIAATIQSLSIDVLVSDGTATTTSNLYILIDRTVQQNTPPSFLNIPASKTVSTSTQFGMPLFTVSATDIDSSDTLTYSFQNATKFPEFLFTINTSSGEITEKTPGYLLAVSNTQQDLNITVSDGTDSVTETLTLNLIPSNQPPVFSSSTFTITVSEGPIGSVVLLNLASSVSDPNGDSITFSLLLSTYSNFFQINPITGTITYAANYFLSVGLPSSVTLTVRASDSVSFTDATAIINILGTTQVAPEFTNLPGGAVTHRSLAPGGYIFTVEATDADPGSNLVFTLETEQDLFAMHPTTGAVTLRQDRTFDGIIFGNTAFHILISVSDGTNTAQETLTVIVF